MQELKLLRQILFVDQICSLPAFFPSQVHLTSLAFEQVAQKDLTKLLKHTNK